MSTVVQHRRGTTAQHATFAGAVAEVTVDTTKRTAVVHDGATLGGIPLAKEADVTGKMNKATYDPNNRATDAFDSANSDYDNATSGLSATKVKGAIDELAAEKAEQSALSAVSARVKAPTRTIINGGTSNVSGTYNRPAGCTKIRVQLQASGGGGGYGRATASNAAVGGGGGGGQWADKLISSPASSYAYFLGANGKGGIASSSTAATAGITSTFGSPAVLTCVAGSAGSSSSSTSTLGGSAAGGDGGIGASGGDLACAGGRGGYGIVFSGSIAFSGPGGQSMLGVAPNGADTSGGPISGAGYGAGGTGGARNDGAQANGGDGAMAVLIIEEFYD